MPTARYFSRYPAFPDNVPIANLPRVSLGKLMANDEAESEQLFQACRESGFFLVDLRGPREGDTMLKDAEVAFDLSEKIHEVDQAELMKYAFKPPGSLFGYKGLGKTKLEDGSPDGFEAYSLSQDDMLGVSPRDNPEIIQAHRKTFHDFFHDAHGIISHLLSHLDKHLGLKPNTLASLSPQDKPSGTLLRLLKMKSSSQTAGHHRTSLTSHTDIGSITMLFNTVGGLQILPADAENTEGNWRYVRPEPGCALINLGDAMVQWSGGILRSNVHRVAAPPGEQAGCTRYSIAYLVRPETNVSMRRFVGGGVIPQLDDGEEDEDVCAGDWQKMRVAQIVSGKEGVPKSIGGRKINGQKLQKAH